VAAAATAQPIHVVLVKRVIEAGLVYGCEHDKDKKRNDYDRMRSKTIFCNSGCGASVQIKYKNNKFIGPFIRGGSNNSSTTNVCTSCCRLIFSSSMSRLNNKT
jgi:hypothetical protein